MVQTDLFKKRMGELGMSVPAAADNTPEKYEAYIREEIVRQGEIAKLMGVTKPGGAEVGRQIRSSPRKRGPRTPTTGSSLTPGFPLSRE